MGLSKVANDLVITEGIAGVWFYHWALPDSFVSLCGARVMFTSIPANKWGCTHKNYHIPEWEAKWCSKCVQLSKDRKEEAHESQ